MGSFEQQGGPRREVGCIEKNEKKKIFGKIFSEKTFFAGLGNAVPGLGNAVPGLGKLMWPSKRTDFLYTYNL